MNVKHRNCGSNHNNLTSLFVKVKKKTRQNKKKAKEKQNETKAISQCLKRQRMS